MFGKSVSSIKGVGEKYVDLLGKCGIRTVEDLILYFPRDYEFISESLDKGVFEGEVIQILKDSIIRKNLIITTIKMEDEFGKIAKIIYFNRTYMKKIFIVGNKYKIFGTFKKKGNNLEILNAEIIRESTNQIIPRYNLVKGLTNKYIHNLIMKVILNIEFEENLIDYLVEKNGLMSLKDAVLNIHKPNNKEELKKAIYRFKYQELIYFFIKSNLLRKKLNGKNQGVKYKIFTDKLIELKSHIPFELTDEQNKVIKEILIQQKSEYSMNRLLQGDVGSGKTIVALITAFNILLNGYKVCIIVPTEILANQHFNDSLILFREFNLDIRLLTGSVKEKEKKIIKNDLKGDKPILLIGTHAVLEDDIEINKLGYVIFDEQHRFGVSQRSKLIHKSKFCDVLVMTATPIPRTLFLYIYNNMEISMIKELPPNRKKIETIHIKQEDRKAIYNIIKSEISKGGQCYFVCPLVEDSEKLDLMSVESLYKELIVSELSKYKISFLHGKMKNSEKNIIMEQFKLGNIDILISTTVIEVGVSVANATLMVIENSERFGLSQLHQLRGRVGRGNKQGLCVLVTKSMGVVTKKRITTLLESNDGFYLSEQDLKIRGSGDMFGYKQHGDTGFVFADIIDDIDVVKLVRQDICEIDKLNSNEVKLFYDNVQSRLDNMDKTICFN